MAPPAQSILPPKASTAQRDDCVQYEPSSHSMSRAQRATMQWPLEGSQDSGVWQPVWPQPGTQAPPEQMLAGAPTHSKSELQPCPASGRAGQPWPSQQCPVIGLQRWPPVQLSDSVQPATQV